MADGIDQNCDGVDTCYRDQDGDTHGSNVTVLGTDLTCSNAGESTTNDDCNDSNGAVYPGAIEIAANGVDDDCDGDEICFRDDDGDGFGNGTVVSADLDCTDPGEATAGGDCDDTQTSIFPGAGEVVADGIDQD